MGAGRTSPPATWSQAPERRPRGFRFRAGPSTMRALSGAPPRPRFPPEEGPLDDHDDPRSQAISRRAFLKGAAAVPLAVYLAACTSGGPGYPRTSAPDSIGPSTP